MLKISISAKRFTFEVLDLGLIDYQEANTIQRNLAQDIYLGLKQSTLILCEHFPVITLGRSAKKEHILKVENELLSSGIIVIATNRGGSVTLHLPGQLVVYPIFDLRLLGRDINLFLRNLEKATILSLQDYGIEAESKPGLTGVWVESKKIASIGVAISHWVITHGLSLNVDCDLNLFSLLKPCGQDIMMTSIVQTKGLDSFKMGEIKEKIIDKFQHVFLLEDNHDKGNLAGIGRRDNQGGSFLLASSSRSKG